jgi:hypothetical protein
MIIDQFHENIVMFNRRNKRIETKSEKNIQLSIWISHSTRSNTTIFIWQSSWLSISLIIQSQYSSMRKLRYLEEVQRYDNSIQIIWIEEYLMTYRKNSLWQCDIYFVDFHNVDQLNDCEFFFIMLMFWSWWKSIYFAFLSFYKVIVRD